MPQFGSNPSVASQNFSATQDANGNSIISSDNAFGASPLGVAARTQTLYGIPNANFDLTCPDPNTAVAVNNSIPYWSLETNGTIATTMVYNATSQNWSVRMDPTGAAAADYAILKTRTYLLNDDAIALRQKAYASLTKQGTTGTAQWSIVLSATYYDDTGAVLSTYNIGTAADTGTWTGINGITTSGSAAISTSAAYADIALTLTAAGSVSGTAKVDVNSVLVATSQSATSSFQITQTFLSSGTWTRPTGVDYVDVVAVSAGNGGRGGDAIIGTVVGGFTNSQIYGGNPGAYVLARNVYVGGTVATVSVGVGTGGAGGVGGTATKLTATQTVTSTNATEGAQGGNSTFGTYILTAPGATNGETISGTATVVVPFSDVITTASQYTKSGSAITAVTYFSSNGYTMLPYQTHTIAAGQNGADGTAIGATVGGSSNATTANLRTVGGSAGPGANILSAGGFRGQTATLGSNSYAFCGTAFPTTSGTFFSGAAVGGAGGGGGAGLSKRSTAGTIQATGGNGGSASANSGCGGGEGGEARCYQAGGTAVFQTTVGTAIGGNGGAGASGYVIVAWIG